MLDRIDPGVRCRLDPARTVSVRHCLQPDAVRGRDDRVHLGVAEMLLEPDRAVVENAAGCHELDDIDPACRILAYGDGARRWRVADAGVLPRGVDRVGKFGCQANRIIGVPSRNRERRPGNQNARPGKGPLCHGVAHREAGEYRPTGIAHRRKPGARGDQRVLQAGRCRIGF